MPPPADPVPMADPRPLAQILNDTASVPAIRNEAAPAGSPRKAPRAATGAEPLWDLAPLNIEPIRPRVETPATPAVVVTVHDKKKPRTPLNESEKRVLIIAAAVIVTLGLAAAGYFLFG